jgi:hypothetical protein
LLLFVTKSVAETSIRSSMQSKISSSNEIEIE